MKVLVTGGAGYIGSVTARRVQAAGHAVEVLDDFSTGHPAALPPGAPLHRGTLLDADFTRGVLARGGFDAVVHFAAFSLVGESVANPLKYWRNNVGGGLNLLEAVADAGVGRFVFSSTAAVYGEPETVPIPETAPTAPVNPYGETKLAVERALAATAERAGFAAVALRYFNACGADGDLGEDHDPETHLIPRLLRSLLDPQVSFRIFGDDFPTPDGTCIRDYIHVADLADAHVRAVERAVAPGFTALNLGTGDGTSVREIVDAASRVTGRALAPPVAPRRDGDPARLVAANGRAAELLGWRPRRSDVDRVVADAWAWHRAHPAGYEDAAERS